MLCANCIVVVHCLSGVSSFLHIFPWKEASLEASDDDVPELLPCQLKRFNCMAQFLHGCSVAHQPVVCVNCDREPVVYHFSEGVGFQAGRGQIWHCLNVAGKAYFQGNPLVRNVLN